MDLKKDFIKIKNNAGVRVLSEKIDFFVDNKIVTLKIKNTSDFHCKVLPLLFEGVYFRTLCKRLYEYSKDSILNLLEILNFNNMLVTFNDNGKKRFCFNKEELSFIQSKKVRDVVNCIIVNPREIKGQEFPFFIVSSRYKIIIGKKIRYYWSTGSDTNFIKAYLKSIFEAMERSHSSLRGDIEIIKASYYMVKDKAVDPREIISYKNEQYGYDLPFKKINFEDSLEWVRVKDYFSKKSKLVLIDEIYYPLSKTFLKRKKYTSANSSGLSFHFCKEDAIKNSLYEIIERDSFMVTWLNSIPMPKISGESLPVNIKERINNLNKKGFSVSIFNITLDLNPVFLTIIHSKKQGFAAFLGAASAEKNISALEKSLTEAETLLYFSYKVKFVEIDKKNVKTPIDHGMYYRDIKNIKNLNFLLESKKVISFNNKSNGNILNKVKEKDILIYHLDLSKDNYSYVIKVIAPSLVPITFGYKNEPLGLERIFELPIRLKLKTKIDIDINEPHPFA